MDNLSIPDDSPADSGYACDMLIRPERHDDADAIGRLTTHAFASAPRTNGAEAQIIAALREAGALLLSLVADIDGQIIGHIAFSPARLGASDDGIFGLGPVSVDPLRQGTGIGTALISDGLARLRNLNARGVVLMGDPGYYKRFGFTTDPALTWQGQENPCVQVLNFGSTPLVGDVGFHPAFEITG